MTFQTTSVSSAPQVPPQRPLQEVPPSSRNAILLIHISLPTLPLQHAFLSFEMSSCSHESSSLYKSMETSTPSSAQGRLLGVSAPSSVEPVGAHVPYLLGLPKLVSWILLSVQQNFWPFSHVYGTPYPLAALCSHASACVHLVPMPDGPKQSMQFIGSGRSAHLFFLDKKSGNDPPRRRDAADVAIRWESSSWECATTPLLLLPEARSVNNRNSFIVNGGVACNDYETLSRNKKAQ
mmetsp:Transcript_12942/g.27483  ORF Transcript_12942/g.27483 Transcript_12942/m.27483 type:complete len:236 (-) Transcript_12942:51-758(-)